MESRAADETAPVLQQRNCNISEKSEGAWQWCFTISQHTVTGWDIMIICLHNTAHVKNNKKMKQLALMFAVLESSICRICS